MFDSDELKFVKTKWCDVKDGELIKVLKDEEFPADMVLLKSDKESGIVFVDTMNLDGEVSLLNNYSTQTNLKEKMAPRDLNQY